MRRRLIIAVAGLAALTACHRKPITQLPGTPNWKPDAEHAKVLADEETKGNGIEVGSPKVYDDASLRMMLDATRAKLAGMTGLDQTSLISRLGSASGATISQTQFGLQVSGPAVPGLQTTTTGPTTQTTTNTDLPQGATVPGTVTVQNAPSTTSVATTAAPSSSPPTVPAGTTFTPPSSLSPSSLDVLNEQMQLSYELTNLQLLLEGALSDRFVASQRFVKPRVTLGFPISLRTPAAFEDAVAVVEVEVESIKQTLSDERPAITALLPREKTYNVAAMTDRMTSIGGGVVMGVVGLGGSFIHGRKTLYLVQDQDTVALQRPSDLTRPNTLSFLWEFRPVLGQHFVRGGMKQTFVQIAMPVLDGVDCYGKIKIRTYWRRFGHKEGTTGPVIPESVLVSTCTFPIPRFDLTPSVGDVALEDLGDGTVLVRVTGTYLGGTYVQLGPTRYDAGRNLIAEDTGLKFVAPVTALARWTGHVVARSGAQTELLAPLAQKRRPALNTEQCMAGPCFKSPEPLPDVKPESPCNPFKIRSVDPTPLNEADTSLHINIEAPGTGNFDREFMLFIGSKVFGLGDAPVKRERSGSNLVVTAVVPTSLLVANPNVRVFRPFWSDVSGNGKQYCDDSHDVPDFGQDSAKERLVLVSVAANGDATYILYGNGLDQAKVLIPSSGTAFTPIDSLPQGRIRLLTITKAALATTKKIVLQKVDKQGPLLLDVPDAKSALPKASVDSPVVQNTDELDVQADRARDITAVTMDDKKLKWKPVDDSTIRLVNLKADGVTDEQKSREVTIQYNNGTSASVKFEVVAARIGVK